MAILKCKMCGGDLDVTDNEKVVECEYCGSKQTVPNSDDEKKVNLFNRANRLRIASEFDKAAGIYEQIIAEFPEEAEAYWCLCLCNYGIEYVDDPASAKKIPTCHRASFEKMRKDENYELALENADMSARIVYEDQAKEIDRIMGDILAVSRDEKPYDIFICYKETDNNGSRTQDSVLAQDIYDALEAKNYRVFFSRITLEDKLGTQYEPYIFSALNSAKLMLVIGTDYEYMNAVWVKNEWSRFLKLMAKDKNKILIPCYKDMDPYDMPDEFKGLQSQDCSKIGFMQDLTRGIDKLFGRNEKPLDIPVEKVIVQQSGDSATINSLLERAFMFLEDGKFDDADTYCEKVLDIDPKNANAYLGKLMAELNVGIRNKLADCREPFDAKDNYKKVIRFGDEKLAEELRGYIAHIWERNENTRISNIYNDAKTMMQKAATESDFNDAACEFEKIKSYEDSNQLAQKCRERAKEEKRIQIERNAEAEEVYNQLLEALKNSDKANTIHNELETLKQKKEKIINSAKKELSRFEKYKDITAGDSDEIDGLKNDIQSFLFKSNQNEKEISSLEKQRDSLGLFAVSRKKELSQKIEKLKDENIVINDDISTLQKGLEIISELSKTNDDIHKFELKLEEENKIKKLSLEEIEKEIKTKKYIFDYINENDRRKKLSWYSGLSSELKKYLKIESLLFGTYCQDNKIRTPIEWISLKTEGKKQLLISKYSIDCRKYNESVNDVTWETCTLRKWLNETFINEAFTKEEQALIVSTNVTADKNPKYTTNPGKVTTDKVFLLSINEAEKYFSSDGARQCKPTKYAVYNGAYANSDNGNCSWWLRSPGDDQLAAADVGYDGSVCYFGGVVDGVISAVRPALWINLDS